MLTQSYLRAESRKRLVVHVALVVYLAVVVIACGAMFVRMTERASSLFNF